MSTTVGRAAAPVKPTLVLVSGLPGAGKTTLSRQLESSLPAVRLCPDEWLDAMGIDLFDEPARDRLEAKLWLLAQDILRQGGSVILESGFWLRSDRDEKRLGGRELGASVVLVVLEVPLDELWRRLSLRGDPAFTRALLEEWASVYELPEEGERGLFDVPGEPGWSGG